MQTQQVILNDNTAVLLYTTGGVKNFSAGILPSATGQYKKSSIESKFKIAKWYDDSKNLEPESILQVLLGNNIAPAILDTKAKFVSGNGVICFKQNVEDGRKSIEVVSIPEIADWISKNNLNDVMFNASKDLHYFGNAFFELIFNRGKKISSINHVDATTVRAEEAKNGRVGHYYLCGNWSKPKYVEGKENEGNVYKVKAHAPIQAEEDYLEIYPKFIYQAKEYTPGLPYYSLPSWYGTLKWLELANTIPAWHLAGIRNGYTVRYLVEVSDAFFNSFSDAAQVTAAKRKLQEELDACLSGAENVGKTIYAAMPHQYFSDKGILRITPITTDLHDEAFSLLFDHSNTAATSGFAIDPTLCGIETQGRLSSGSEKRIAYELWLRLHAVRPRQTLLKVLDTVKIINGWDKKYPGMTFGIENVSLTTLDENPTGYQNTIAG